MYFKRHILTKFNKYLKSFPIVLITGARQIGKSTFLQEEFKKAKFYTLDDNYIFSIMKKDPLSLIGADLHPLVFDEIQLVPKSFRSFKLIIDKKEYRNKTGLYILTGSEKFRLMKSISDSLAGRVGIIDMMSLSNREIDKIKFNLPFFPVKKYFEKRESSIKKYTDAVLWDRIIKGSMPKLFANKNIDYRDYFSSYIATYIERDVNNFAKVADKYTFMVFMTALAARTGELLNYDALAREVGINVKTAKAWISILEATNIIYILRPMTLNVKKRVVKTPKIYFTNTGIVCYLCGWRTKENAMTGAMAGSLYETFVVNEILKSYANGGEYPEIYFYRDSNKNEIDLVILQDRKMYPIEIKKYKTPNMHDFLVFDKLKAAFPDYKFEAGGIVCNYDRLECYDKNKYIIPIEYI